MIGLFSCSCPSRVPFESAPILRKETLEMMEQHSVGGGPLQMSRKIDSRHGRRMASRNGPSLEHFFLIAQDGSSILEGGEQTQECGGEPGNLVFWF